MSNKLLGKIIIVLVVLICIFLLIYTFTKKDSAKNDNIGNYNDTQSNDNLNGSENKEEQNNNDQNNNEENNNEENNNEQPNNNNQNQEENNKEENQEQDNNQGNNDLDNSNNKTPVIGNKGIVVEDRSKGACAQAIEYFYEDNNYRYYFTCIKSGNMYVIVNGKEYKLVYALQNNIVTMTELENNGYKFLKESKNLQDR